jgi:hypothetical protein
MTRQLHRSVVLAALFVLFASFAACSGSSVSDEESARFAYEGLDPSIDKILDLGFQGFNAADSANIPEQSTTGDVSGTLTINGQVDQGSSDNKGMRLEAVYVNYSDGVFIVEEGEEDVLIEDIVYDSDGFIDVDLSMKGLPDAELTGTMVGTVIMTGGLEGPVALNLSITGETEDDGTGKIQRKAGTIRITGTATSDYGVFDVDIEH